MQYQPPGMAIGQHGVGVEPHAVPAPPPEPEEPPFDCMSFPPGLIPKLVEDKLQIDPPYTPLTPEDIQRCPVPPPPKMDDYLKARLDKFYAQLAVRLHFRSLHALTWRFIASIL